MNFQMKVHVNGNLIKFCVGCDLIDSEGCPALL